MIYRYVYGTPCETGSVAEQIPVTEGAPLRGAVDTDGGFRFTLSLDADDIVYGLGEANHGINKRGHRYVSNCMDNDLHTEDTLSLYGAHNFLAVDSHPAGGAAHAAGFFFDCPAVMAYDVGFTDPDLLEVTCGEADLALYLIEGESAWDVVRQFRRLIGRSYIPPKFAFGFCQSRWGYKTEDDFREVAAQHRSHHVPLDMICMDIDYMDAYKDFTVNPDVFPDFPAFVEEMRAEKIHLVPIIDAGVKIEDGYPVYEEGKERGYFCRTQDGELYRSAVWPGMTHFPDVLRPEVREWFGNWYKGLLDAGIDAFWNDMNEPAIFYTEDGIRRLHEILDHLNFDSSMEVLMAFGAMNDAVRNNPADYAAIYHEVNGEPVCHSRVHNLYSACVVRAAAEAFERLRPGERLLLFSRSSFIGMHRCAGIWTGDNKSWWSHLLLNIKMLPSLNMCGFLYVGADVGGFGGDVSRDLLLRWLALGVFMPLMRNHSALFTREQEFYRFSGPEDFEAVIKVRYRLIPYLYSEYLKAAYGDDLYFLPLGFVYPDDPVARETEDQLMVGGDIMIAPVYTQNASGRLVYLPEEMMFVCFGPDGAFRTKVLPAGVHRVDVALNEVPLFIRKGHAIPVADAAECVEDIDYGTIQMVGYPGAVYEFQEDEGA